ncbi:hypothetical protein BY996DRAFT_6417044 [Phakopsora pachyrhizi]|nr:hypothetical protein BY996DRAFT_6417044 [Phakopsora pachyrhizi]
MTGLITETLPRSYTTILSDLQGIGVESRHSAQCTMNGSQVDENNEGTDDNGEYNVQRFGMDGSARNQNPLPCRPQSAAKVNMSIEPANFLRRTTGIQAKMRQVVHEIIKPRAKVHQSDLQNGDVSTEAGALMGAPSTFLDRMTGLLSSVIFVQYARNMEPSRNKMNTSAKSYEELAFDLKAAIKAFEAKPFISPATHGKTQPANEIPNASPTPEEIKGNEVDDSEKKENSEPDESMVEGWISIRLCVKIGKEVNHSKGNCAFNHDSQPAYQADIPMFFYPALSQATKAQSLTLTQSLIASTASLYSNAVPAVNLSNCTSLSAFFSAGLSMKCNRYSTTLLSTPALPSASFTAIKTSCASTTLNSTYSATGGQHGSKAVD